jgi:hypothetical protein
VIISYDILSYLSDQGEEAGKQPPVEDLGETEQEQEKP